MSAGTIAPIVLGFVTLVACGFYEAYAKQKYAIFPPEVMNNFRGFVVLQIATFLLGMLYYSIAVLWPAQVQALYADTNLHIGWYAAAGGLASILFCPFWGFMQKKVPHSRWQLLVYTGLMTICCGCLATSTPTSNVSSTALVALSFAFVSAVSIFATSMVQLNVKHEHIGVASGLTVTMRTLGGAVATTIYLTILNNKLTSNLPKYVATPLAKDGVALALIPDVILALTSGDTTSPVLGKLTPKALFDAVNGLKGAYANAFRLVYLVSIAFGVIGTVTVAFASNVDHLMTRQVDVKLAEGAHIKVQTDTGEGHMIRQNDEQKLDR
jgi:MFS family permease